MKLLSNGRFSDLWEATDFIGGLRVSSNIPRSSKTLEVCNGLIGYNGHLTSDVEISVSDLIDNPLVTQNDFPFPQIFSLDKHLLICNRDSILEMVNGDLVLKATVTVGELWTVASFQDFIFLSNGIVNIVRDPVDGTYTSTTEAPICSALFNFNGQVICGNLK